MWCYTTQPAADGEYWESCEDATDCAAEDTESAALGCVRHDNVVLMSLNQMGNTGEKKVLQFKRRREKDWATVAGHYFVSFRAQDSTVDEQLMRGAMQSVHLHYQPAPNTNTFIVATLHPGDVYVHHTDSIAPLFRNSANNLDLRYVFSRLKSRVNRFNSLHVNLLSGTCTPGSECRSKALIAPRSRPLCPSNLTARPPKKKRLEWSSTPRARTYFMNTSVCAVAATAMAPAAALGLCVSVYVFA